MNNQHPLNASYGMEPLRLVHGASTSTVSTEATAARMVGIQVILL